MSPVQSALVYRAWTREGLAIRAGVTVDDIYRAELGETPDGVLLAALAKALDVPADLLVE